MLVVIDIPDWEDNSALVRELGLLQESHDRIVSDPEYDAAEDEGDETMRLKTDMVVLDVARVVGYMDDSSEVGYSIKPLTPKP